MSVCHHVPTPMVNNPALVHHSHERGGWYPESTGTLPISAGSPFPGCTGEVLEFRQAQ